MMRNSRVKLSQIVLGLLVSGVSITASARYIEADPIGLAGKSWSTYTYVNGNPVHKVDPKGLEGSDGFSWPSQGYSSNLTSAVCLNAGCVGSSMDANGNLGPTTLETGKTWGLGDGWTTAAGVGLTLDREHGNTYTLKLLALYDDSIGKLKFGTGVLCIASRNKNKFGTALVALGYVGPVSGAVITPVDLYGKNPFGGGASVLDVNAFDFKFGDLSGTAGAGVTTPVDGSGFTGTPDPHGYISGTIDNFTVKISGNTDGGSGQLSVTW